MKNNRKALIITESGHDNSFIDCEIAGAVEVAGRRNKFIRTKILEYGARHPAIVSVGLVVGFVASIITIMDRFHI